MDGKGRLVVFDSTRAFSSFAVDDIEAAKRFYGETLGLQISEQEGLLAVHLDEGKDIVVYPKPDHAPAVFTVLNFPVEDIEETVDELAQRGVRFERYEDFDQDEKGIARQPGAPSIAWFTDPAGNIISVLQEP
jgi:catechol 2,3-dioxygenase-like lactoylglutathione lyase family enzyme